MKRFDVTIAGELNLDLILYGLPEILHPERELLASDMNLTLGSSSAIVAHNLASLGRKVGFSCCVGDDHFGEVAVQWLRTAGVDLSTVRSLGPDVKTGLTVILPRQAWRNILTYPGSIAALTRQHLDVAYLSSARHFHLSSYFLQSGLRADLPALLTELKAAGLTVSLDTNDDPDDLWQSGIEKLLPLVDVLLPNECEAMRIAGTDNLDDALAWLSEVVPLVVVKRGLNGSLARRGREQTSAAALEQKAVDSVGAGDSFNAGFLSEFVRGASLERCLRMGNIAGALSTTKAGGAEAFRDTDHRESFLQRYAACESQPTRE